MKRIVLTAIAIVSTFNFQLSTCLAQTDVTSKYIDNPGFEARFAGWENAGMTFNTSKNYEGQDGMVFMEKWVSKGSKVGSATSMKQTLTGLPVGTYTLTVTAQNIQQGKDAQQTGAFIYAGSEEVEISANADYSVTFTVLQGTAEIGLKTKNCTGNWVCIDNFRLYSNGLLGENANQEIQKLITEAEAVVGDGVTGTQLQTAIDDAKTMLADKPLYTGEEYQAMANTLSRAILTYRISNATGTVPTVTTEPFVPTGVTIALGRMTVKGTSKERGFCWSTEPEPTIFDNRSIRYFSNNGNIYCMEHMQPATIYYVRAYAITAGWQVAYGDVVKIATLPKGNVTTWYDNAGDEQTNYRIASAVNEVQWLYDNLANIRGFNLSVHYSPGSGAGGGTADCSYGGWMRVSQNTPYQQTGTILHETNHGVGVGTTNEWYNNSNLRAETSRGLWLGPRANQIVKFLENDQTATLTGDGTHMWPYGINGAQEDSYNPESTILYFGNVFTTHALHQDGLICSSNVGFATPAYVFQQDDETKYYLTSEETDNTKFLTMTSAGALRMEAYNAEKSDNFAWRITYDPKTSYYMFYNVGMDRYMTYNSGFKGVKRTGSPTSADKFHLFPARVATTIGDYTGTGFWITYNKGANTLQSGTNAPASKALDFSNSATGQHWLFLTEDQLQTYNQETIKVAMTELDKLIASTEAIANVPHIGKEETTDLSEVDGTLTIVVDGIKDAKTGYTTINEVTDAISQLESALVSFLGNVKPQSMDKPFDLTFLLTNPGLDTDCSGWSTTTTNSYSCCEFFQTTFDFNQTTPVKLPIGTYELKVQAYQRAGSASETYTAYNAGTSKVNTTIYLKTKTQKVKDIWADAQNRSLGGSTSNSGGKYVPNNMLAASKWFAAGWYENSVFATNTIQATLKLGIKGTTSNDSYWTCFDNFRLYFYGNYTIDQVTGVESIQDANLNTQDGDGAVYDLSGRRILTPLSTSQSSLKKGLYIINGRKVLVK